MGWGGGGCSPVLFLTYTQTTIRVKSGNFGQRPCLFHSFIFWNKKNKLSKQ